jgi:adenylate kinase
LGAVKQRLVILGAPASGKGTQAAMIRERFGIETASPGAMLRAEKAAGTALGMEADRQTSNGQLLPDATIVKLVDEWLAVHDGAFTFDGYPRTIGQAEALESILKKRGTPLEAAILLDLDLDFDTILHRVQHRLVCASCGATLGLGFQVASDESPCPKCGGKLTRRSDDNPATLEHRMAEYREKTEPLVSYYRVRGILYEVDASRPPDEVFASIAAILQ